MEISSLRILAEEGSYLEIATVYEEAPFTIDTPFLWSAARAGNLAALRFAKDHGASFDVQGIVSLVYTAAYSGHHECLQFLHENIKLESDSPPITEAVLYIDDHSLAEKMLRWVVEEGGYSLTDHVCTLAAKKGHMEALQYAHEHGATWNKLTSSAAAMNGDVTMLQYLYEHGCPIPNNVLLQAAPHIDCVEYILNHIGCTWHPDFLYQLLIRIEDEEKQLQRVQYYHEKYECPILLSHLSYCRFPKVRAYIQEHGTMETHYSRDLPPIPSRIEK